MFYIASFWKKILAYEEQKFISFFGKNILIKYEYPNVVFSSVYKSSLNLKIKLNNKGMRPRMV